MGGAENPPPSAGTFRLHGTQRGSIAPFSYKNLVQSIAVSRPGTSRLRNSLVWSPAREISLPAAGHRFQARGFPQIPLLSLLEPEGEGAHLGDTRQSFKLLLSSVCQSWGWEEPSGAGVGEGAAWAAPTQLLGAGSGAHPAGEGPVRQGDPVGRGLEGRWPRTEQHLGQAPSTRFCSYSSSTHPGLAGVCLQAALCIALFHICCAEIMMWVGFYSHNKYHVPCASVKLFSL